MEKTVYLDFDGTLVEFAWPRVGVENPRWKPVVRKLIIAGWKVVLNTARIQDMEYESFSDAQNWLLERMSDYDFDFTHKKLDPDPWNPKENSTTLYIDDLAPNIPTLRDGRKRPLVHWGDISKDLKKVNLI